MGQSELEMQAQNMIKQKTYAPTKAMTTPNFIYVSCNYVIF